MGQIISGVPLFAQSVDTANTDNQSNNVIFNARSTSTTSHYIDVSETAILVRAFGLDTGQTITVNMVGNDGVANVTTPLKIHSKVIQLSPNNTALVIDLPGRYNFTLSAGLGTVSCMWIATGVSYWSWGLAAFANAT